jgi:hypothetical protein
MKTRCLATLILASFALMLTGQEAKEIFPIVKGPYLGQKPPGTTPEIFAPGIVSLEANFECCRAISPDAKEFFFVREVEGGDKIFRMSEEKTAGPSRYQSPTPTKRFSTRPSSRPQGTDFYSWPVNPDQ